MVTAIRTQGNADALRMLKVTAEEEGLAAAVEHRRLPSRCVVRRVYFNVWL